MTAKTDPAGFGRLVRHYRTQLGLTQQQIGKKVGVSTGYVGLIEQGQRGAKPTREMARRFAEALDLGLEATEALFRAAGHLGVDESLTAANTVIRAIEADDALPEVSKRLLVTTYLTLSRSRVRR